MLASCPLDHLHCSGGYALGTRWWPFIKLQSDVIATVLIFPKETTKFCPLLVEEQAACRSLGLPHGSWVPTTQEVMVGPSATASPPAASGD